MITHKASTNKDETRRGDSSEHGLQASHVVMTSIEINISIRYRVSTKNKGKSLRLAARKPVSNAKCNLVMPLDHKS